MLDLPDLRNGILVAVRAELLALAAGPRAFLMAGKM
jgi:hypothetical protein